MSMADDIYGLLNNGLYYTDTLDTFFVKLDIKKIEDILIQIRCSLINFNVFDESEFKKNIKSCIVSHIKQFFKKDE